MDEVVDGHQSGLDAHKSQHSVSNVKMCCSKTSAASSITTMRGFTERRADWRRAAEVVVMPTTCDKKLKINTVN
jgi:hypothetical protein